jgi:quercetin dioxygenase-like cupin family protein
MQPSTAIQTRRFEQPDDQLDFASHGRIEIVKLRDGTAGMHAVLEPGWRWAEHEKPLLGNPDACPMGHVGYCIGGELVVRMVVSGEERHIRTGDFFEIPPGHDAHVEGGRRCELILFAAPDHGTPL